MIRKLKKFLQVTVVPYIVYLFSLFVLYTNKKRFHFPKNIPSEPLIVSVWHGQLLMCAMVLNKIRNKKSFKAIVSTHSDGESITKVLDMLGIDGIRGSSRKGGAKALIGAIKEIKRGSDIAITPDGPKGPIYSVANGIVAISQKTNSKILAFSCKPSKYWQFNSWDKFKIPKPFGIIDFYVSEPFDVNGMELEEAKEFIKMKMMENFDV